MANQSRSASARIASTVNARYHPTETLVDAYYLNGRFPGRREQSSVDTTREGEDRGFFNAIYAHSPEENTQALAEEFKRLQAATVDEETSIESLLNHLLTLGERILGKNPQGYFAASLIKNGETVAVTAGSALAFLYIDGVLYPMTESTAKMEAVDEQGRELPNFQSAYGGTSGSMRYSIIQSLQERTSFFLCTQNLWDKLGQAEVLRVLNAAQDQGDAAYDLLDQASEMDEQSMQVLIAGVRSLGEGIGIAPVPSEMPAVAAPPPAREEVIPWDSVPEEAPPEAPAWQPLAAPAVTTPPPHDPQGARAPAPYPEDPYQEATGAYPAQGADPYAAASAYQTGQDAYPQEGRDPYQQGYPGEDYGQADPYADPHYAYGQDTQDGYAQAYDQNYTEQPQDGYADYQDNSQYYDPAQVGYDPQYDQGYGQEADYDDGYYAEAYEDEHGNVYYPNDGHAGATDQSEAVKRIIFYAVIIIVALLCLFALWKLLTPGSAPAPTEATVLPPVTESQAPAPAPTTAPSTAPTTAATTMETTPPTTAEPTGDRSHVVVTGDTLWGIAMQYYGAADQLYLDLIINANPSIGPDQGVYVGDTLTIPPSP